MFRRVPLSLPILIFCTALFTSACGDPPRREMDQAQGAIDAARAAGADRYAIEEYQAAVEALKQAEEAVTQRDYRLALNHAIDSRERAQNAAKEAAGQQATLRSAAERRLGEVTAMLAQANSRLATAEVSRLPRKALSGARAAIASADVSLQKSGTQITEGDYKASQVQLAETAALLNAATVQLDDLASAKGAKPSAKPRR